LALSSYVILNTINPKLVENNISLGVVAVGIEVVDYPDVGDNIVDPDFKSGKAKYSKDASLSQGVKDAVVKLQQGGKITSFSVYTNDRMAISVTTNGKTEAFMVDISHGFKGFAAAGTAKQGDNKTPIGTWKIIDIRKSASGNPVFNSKGSNMGAAFFHLSPMKDGERGIGMHGNKNGTLTPTNGCIRIKNADIEALLPYVTEGTPVYISG
jgi:lipoprotein-anchoring transpeptidase ErfK/SrfK